MAETNKTDTNKKAFLEAYAKTAGNVSDACKKIGISRTTYYEWFKEDEQFAQSVDDVKEASIDLAESALKKQILEGNTTSIIFFLKTQGRKRGYGDEIALTGKDGTPLMPSFPTDITVIIDPAPITPYLVDADKTNKA